MKKTLVFGGLLLFLFVGFRPPAGMSKLPRTNIDFQESQYPIQSLPQK
ncbi:hypothetical protein H6770_05215 [Candidatus Peribacteria bacterium]|nr:hypothetical protein [Candidatus Peribacteria bacterium]